MLYSADNKKYMKKIKNRISRRIQKKRLTDEELHDLMFDYDLLFYYDEHENRAYYNEQLKKFELEEGLLNDI